MKQTKLMAIVILLVLGVSSAAAQSLGDYARTVRKNRTSDASTASHHYDNDNLPTNDALSVVGPASNTPDTAQAEASSGPNGSTGAATGANGTTGAAKTPSTAEERKKAEEEWKTKLGKQQEKIDALNHELDLDQRELKLRQATEGSDPVTRLRYANNYGKQDGDSQTDIEAKQKAIAAAQQEMTDLQEQARKAGIKEKDKDDNSPNNK